MSATQTQSQQEFVATRFFDAPCELMFKLWTDPKHLAAWWGPKHFTNPISEWEVRPGGAIHVEMRGPDGTLYPMVGTYKEIVPNEKLVFICGVPDDSGKLMFEVQNTATFAAKDKGTTVTITARVLSRGPNAEQYLKGMAAGWSQSLDKLTELAAEEAAIAQPPLRGDRELIVTRLFSAPRETVFKMFSDPEHLARWWGPKGFTTTTQNFEFKPGGVWRHVMHGPDGKDYPNVVTYISIEAPNKLVYKHGGEKDHEPVNFQTTVTIETVGSKTKVTMHGTFPSAAAREFVIKTYEADKGMVQTVTRLGEEVAKLSAEHPPFIISRTYKAPRDLVWKAWTELDRLKQWFGPKGFTMPFAKMDIRPGGMMLYKLEAPDGSPMWGKFVYQEITPPDKLVWINSFSDEKGGTTRHPMAPTWPAEMLTTVTLTEHQGQTTVTVRSEAYNASPAEQKTFTDNHNSMKGGWTGTFEQLAAYLAKA